MLITDILDNSARRYPEKIAVRFNGDCFTYAELADRVNRLAAALVDLGVLPGERVAVVCANSNAYLEILFACARIGAVSMHFNLRMSPLVTVQLVKKTKPRVLFCSCEQSDVYEYLKERVSQETTFISLTETLGLPALPLSDTFVKQTTETVGKQNAQDNVLLYDDLIASREPSQLVPRFDSSDDALMLFTSGTTGLPRAVLHTHGSVVLQVMISAMEGRVSHDETVLCVLPLFHTTMILALQALYVGAELVIGASSKPADIAAAIAAFNITRVTLVPYLMQKLARYVEEQGITLPSLKTIGYGAEPMSPEMAQYCQKQFACNFHEGYGMTETMATVTTLSAEQHKDPSKLATVGKPIFGVKLKVVDAAGNECVQGTAGEILVKTGTLMKGYWQDAERTAEVIQDGWYCTQDIGYLDAEGFLHLVDRKQNMIISGGENIYPLEVSKCILAMGEEIIDAAVVGVYDEEWGEALIAAVVCKETSSLSASDITEHCAKYLARYKRPRSVYFLKEIPRSETGKVMAKLLREQIDALQTNVMEKEKK
jgi:long-chain acyl-CoA synthetase